MALMTKIVKNRPTQKQIAEKLGLSAATVSLALRDNPVVAKATRDLVQQAMRDTGYVRNLAAASLRTGRSNIVGVSFHTVAHSFYGDLLVALERVFDAAGTVILINNHEGDVEKLDRFISTLATYGADALLVAPPPGTSLSVMERVGKHGMQVQYLGNHVEDDDSTDMVVVDERASGELAARHLFEAGFERLCMIGGQPDGSVTRARVAGFCSVVEGYGVPCPDDLWRPCHLSPAGAAEALNAMLDRNPAPTGIVCSGNTVSRVAPMVLRNRGLEPGRDVGLVGIGTERGAESSVSTMTMVCGDMDTMGRLSAETLLARLAEPERERSRIVIEPTLILGKTSGGSRPVPNPPLAA